jgi:hypothetical protein
MIQSVLLSPQVLALVVGLVITLATIPGGLLQQALMAILARFQRNIPAEQYAKLQQLAADAVAGIHQIGESQGWASADRKNEAVTAVQSALKSHGITRFDQTVVATMVEKAYAEFKTSLPAPLVNAVDTTVKSLEMNDVVQQPAQPAAA